MSLKRLKEELVSSLVNICSVRYVRELFNTAYDKAIPSVKNRMFNNDPLVQLLKLQCRRMKVYEENAGWTQSFPGEEELDDDNDDDGDDSERLGEVEDIQVECFLEREKIFEKDELEEIEEELLPPLLKP